MDIMSDKGPWAIYRSDVRPTSAGRVLLADLLEFVMSELSGEPDSNLFETFARRDETAEDDRASVRSYVRWLGLQFLEGHLVSYVRPFGGGESVPLPASRWEMDDFEARFALSATDPANWSNSDAPPTHWIFVTEKSLDLWWEEWSRGEADNPDAALTPVLVGRVERNLSPTADPLSLLRLPEVIALTGMSRSTLYDRIAAGRFPEPLRLGTRMSRWRLGEIQHWLRQGAVP
jgi:prophage regulatory protein